MPWRDVDALKASGNAVAGLGRKVAVGDALQRLQLSAGLPGLCNQACPPVAVSGPVSAPPAPTAMARTTMRAVFIRFTFHRTLRRFRRR